jgi:NADH-quinone oxidoreductase subunit M
LRGAVLQMIAHGFVVVGLFLLQTLFIEGMKLELSMKWEVFVHKPKFASLFLILVLAQLHYQLLLTLLENLQYI